MILQSQIKNGLVSHPLKSNVITINLCSLISQHEAKESYKYHTMISFNIFSAAIKTEKKSLRGLCKFKILKQDLNKFPSILRMKRYIFWLLLLTKHTNCRRKKEILRQLNSESR